MFRLDFEDETALGGCAMLSLDIRGEESRWKAKDHGDSRCRCRVEHCSTCLATGCFPNCAADFFDTADSAFLFRVFFKRSILKFFCDVTKVLIRERREGGV